MYLQISKATMVGTKVAKDLRRQGGKLTLKGF